MSTVARKLGAEPIESGAPPHLEAIRSPPRRRGTPEAETALLYGEHRDRILAFCTGRLGSRAEAEDATQETFAYVLRLLRRGVVPETELSWLYKIAFNVCRWKRRTLWRRGRLETSADFGLLQEVVPAPERNGDRLHGLGEALTAMPSNQRRAFVLREFRGLSYKEIAEILCVSESAVATLLFRARASLASRLQRGGQKLTAVLNGMSLVAFLRRVFDGGNLTAGLATLAVTTATLGAAPPVRRHIAELFADPPAAIHHVRPASGDAPAPRARPRAAERHPVHAGSTAPRRKASTAAPREVRPTAVPRIPADDPPAVPSAVPEPAPAPRESPPVVESPPPAQPSLPAPTDVVDVVAPVPVAVPPAVTEAADAVAAAAPATVSTPAPAVPPTVDLPPAPVPVPAPVTVP